MKYFSILALSFMTFFLFSSDSWAQETKPMDQQPVHLSAEQLQAVTGYFQSPRNPDMYIQFTAIENGLQGKLLWNNNQIKFTPESDLVFINLTGNEGNPLRLTFKKDSAGSISQMSLGNNELWKRIKDYKPIVKVEMPHTPEQLKPFEGVFQMQNGQQRFIQFSVKDNKLSYQQQGDAAELLFVPETDLSFFNKDLALWSMVFTKDADGTVSQVLMNKQQTFKRLLPVHLTTDQIKLFEGKYQSKDDEDNVIELIARDNQLVVKQLWDKKEIILTAQTEVYFYNAEQKYSLQFMKDKDGTLTQQIKILGIDVFSKMK